MAHVQSYCDINYMTLLAGGRWAPLTWQINSDTIENAFRISKLDFFSTETVSPKMR